LGASFRAKEAAEGRAAPGSAALRFFCGREAAAKGTRPFASLAQSVAPGEYLREGLQRKSTLRTKK